MAYESGEFDPGIGNRPFPGATAFFNNCLWLMGSTDKEGKIRYTTLSLLDSKAVPLDIEGGKATVSSNWTTQKFDGGFCVSRSALAVCGDVLLLERGDESADCEAATSGICLLHYGQYRFAVVIADSDVRFVRCGAEAGDLR
jgi:hypothetical protein